MPIPFSTVCDLLEQSYRLCQASKSNTPAVQAWFQRHRDAVDAHDTGLAALLSTLLPEKRTDRVYCIQASTLERVVGRGLMLGASRMLELAAYKRPGTGLDLADCVEKILNTTPNPEQNQQFQVTVEEIDELLHGLAARIRWSSPSVRSPDGVALSHRSRGDLEHVYRRLSARDAKWFTRLVLKDYQPLIFDAHLLYRSCDPVLPCLLKIREDFTEALDAIAIARGVLLPTGGAAAAEANARRVLAVVRPKIGVKVGRQQWHKGRSIKHCIDMGGGGRMSVETKMDGEYCQVHVDVSRAGRRVQIFSKSGKDSTEDREKVIPAIERALRLGSSECKFQKACILEGELVVYNDLENVIMPFHKIRKHVTRRGRFMNTEQDSQPKPYERLMMVYYDVLLLDDQSLMDVRHSERAKLLEKIIHPERGTSALVERQTIDFGHALAASALRKAFAKVVIARGEGLVLKPDEPYIVVGPYGRTTSCRCIKLKKEYIGSFGDVGDFALVGAGFHAAKARTYRIPNLKWTHFYIGCLTNKEQVKRWDEKPEFTVVCAVELPEALLRSFLPVGELSAVPRADNAATKIVVPPGIECPTGLSVAFTSPAVVDLRCFSFDKPGNVGFWTPRFPAVSKIHADRDCGDVLSFEEMQELAREAVDKPAMEDSQENLHWIAKLESADPRGIAVDAVSQATADSGVTPSPMRSTQSTTGVRTQSESQTSATARCSQSVALTVSGELEGGERRDATVSIISISSSSAAGEMSPQKSRSTPMKRIQEMPAPYASFKRQCTHSFRSKPAVPPIGNSQMRQPLGVIDVNASYGETQSADTLDSQTTVKMEPREEKENKSVAMPVERVVIEILDSEDEDEPTQRIDSQRLLQTSRLEQVEKSLEHSLTCKYVGASCGLIGRIILLSSATLLEDQNVTSLFRDHGVDAAAVIPSIETWWSEHQHDETNDSPVQGKPSRMLLVDSVRRGAETKALVARLNEARREHRRDEHDWISVYDWRVLKHISVAEDGGIEKKYYDGFQDPWRRWYCGLV